ncbi:MAG: type I-U CRISPR-associated protein Cas5/Cas6 [Armatimonadetes bacterium]|nr:type I-U CRISPR-associated protein Cas5/Cas6 [Armatimonadota bacterium]
MLSAMSYFGRAESWVEARLNPDWTGSLNCLPCGAEESRQQGERVAVAVPRPAAEYAAWREEAFAEALARELKKKRKAKLTAKQQGDLEATYASDLFAALHAETTDLRKQGWLLPPAATKAAYRLPADALRARPQTLRPPARRQPTMALFALAGSVLPRLTDCVYVAETMRQALMKWSDGAAVFAGKDAGGAPLEGHRHAFFLPTDDDNDGRLDHLIVYCREGFDPSAQQAFAGVRRLWQASGRPDLHLTLLGLGRPEDYGGLDPRAGQTPALAASRVWVSRTPLVLTRHPKLRKDGTARADCPEQQVQQALSRLGQPAPIAVERRHCTEAAGRPVRWLDFARERRRGNQPPVDSRGWGFEIRFEKEVRGPLALGYACHFGLGQFIASAE